MIPADLKLRKVRQMIAAELPGQLSPHVLRRFAEALDEVEQIEGLLYRAHGGLERHGVSCQECHEIAAEILKMGKA